MQSVITHLLIVALLICPLSCLGEAAQACAAPEQPACCHARGCEAQSRDEAPAAPRQQDADCVCHGAIVGVAKIDGPQIASGHLPPLAVDAPAVAICDVDQAARFRSCDARDLPSESGRYLCALFCTRLL